MNRYYTKSMSDGEEISSISQDPVNILFNPSVIQKKDVWKIKPNRNFEIINKNTRGDW